MSSPASSGPSGARCKSLAGEASSRRPQQPPERRTDEQRSGGDANALTTSGRIGNAAQPRPSRESSATLLSALRKQPATSAPRPKAALRRKFVLRYSTLAYQHEQPSRIHIGWHSTGSVAFPVRQRVSSFICSAEGQVLPLDREKPYQRWSSGAAVGRRLERIRRDFPPSGKRRQCAKIGGSRSHQSAAM